MTASRKTKTQRLAAPRRLDGAIIRHRRRNASAAVVVAALAAVSLLGACSRGGDWRTPPPAGDAADSQAGYVTPPRFTAFDRLPDGQIQVVGRAEPNARVRLSSPDGAAYGATTDSRGAFSLAVPKADGVRLFGLAEDVGGRLIQGEGYLALLPAPGRPAILLRAGVGAQAPGASSAAPQIAAVDFDAGGGAVVSGLAHPGSSLRLSIDGAPGGEARADAQGRFSFALAAMVKPGDHELVVLSPGGQAHARFSVGPSGPITGLPFRGQRQAGDWRIDWLTPGGGAQTTLIMD